MTLRAPRVAWQWLYAVTACVYLLAFPYHPGLRSPNELCRLWQTRALVDFGTLQLNPALRAYGAVGDLSVKDGRYYPSKAPLMSFSAVPIYAVLRAAAGGQGAAVSELALVFWSRLFLTVFPTLAMLVLLRRFLRTYLASTLADALTLTYALGSMALSYSLAFMSHQVTAVLVFCAFYALWRLARREWRLRGYFVAGALAGAAIACEYTAVLGAAGLVVYGVMGLVQAAPRATGAGVPTNWERLNFFLRATGATLVGALPFVLALLTYHWLCFGHPLDSGYKYLNDRAYQPWHVGGFLGIRLPNARAFLLSFLSPLRGLLIISPFFWLAVAGFDKLRRLDKPLFTLSALLAVGYAYFTSSFSYDSWGWSSGPRHLTPWLPFLLLPVGLGFERMLSLSTRWGRLTCGLAMGLAVSSVVVMGTIAGLNYIPSDVSTSLFGLALPLYISGYFPPHALRAARSVEPSARMRPSRARAVGGGPDGLGVAASGERGPGSATGSGRR